MGTKVMIKFHWFGACKTLHGEILGEGKVVDCIPDQSFPNDIGWLVVPDIEISPDINKFMKLRLGFDEDDVWIKNAEDPEYIYLKVCELVEDIRKRAQILYWWACATRKFFNLVAQSRFIVLSEHSNMPAPLSLS